MSITNRIGSRIDIEGNLAQNLVEAAAKKVTLGLKQDAPLTSGLVNKVALDQKTYGTDARSKYLEYQNSVRKFTV